MFLSQLGFPKQILTDQEANYESGDAANALADLWCPTPAYLCVPFANEWAS